MFKLHDRVALFNAIVSKYIYLTAYQHSHLQYLPIKDKSFDDNIISGLQPDVKYY